jgi:hypothetical protein
MKTLHRYLINNKFEYTDIPTNSSWRYSNEHLYRLDIGIDPDFPDGNEKQHLDFELFKAYDDNGRLHGRGVNDWMFTFYKVRINNVNRVNLTISYKKGILATYDHDISIHSFIRLLESSNNLLDLVSLETKTKRSLFDYRKKNKALENTIKNYKKQAKIVLKILDNR